MVVLLNPWILLDLMLMMIKMHQCCLMMEPSQCESVRGGGCVKYERVYPMSFSAGDYFVTKMMPVMPYGTAWLSTHS